MKHFWISQKGCYIKYFIIIIIIIVNQNQLTIFILISVFFIFRFSSFYEISHSFVRL